ncbi:MAG: transketolase C-terminal domain-containing protein [Patescibacteria group bacterium]|nr:transketolase C-terminal domain-containing protein [Patescibacteria group bacterium]MDD5164190.1 transketolase C-terminal domain-containing protein [Patescibacteria group bacterium]MDD5534476.1 transketolase C-terminal domain-containing protein [Patescibacteria group bacterium]
MFLKNKKQINKRFLSYSLAINEAVYQMMSKNKSVFVIGQGVKSPWYVGNTCRDLLKKFGPKMVMDTPISENVTTGVGIGAGMVNMKPIVIFPRMDFMMYALDPIINEAANWHYMFGGKANADVVIRAIINRGGEQGAQHSQALQSLFTHIPGLKVVMPATAYDAKGLMISAIRDPNPVIYIDDRWLYDVKDHVPQKIYSVPIGKGAIRKIGKDITIVAISYMVKEALIAAAELRKQKIDAEIIDLRSAWPIDIPLIIKSVKKTGRLLITEAAWSSGSISSEINSQIARQSFKYLKAPIERLCLPDCPAPVSKILEQAYYLTSKDVIKKVKNILNYV